MVQTKELNLSSLVQTLVQTPGCLETRRFGDMRMGERFRLKCRQFGNINHFRLVCVLYTAMFDIRPTLNSPST